LNFYFFSCSLVLSFARSFLHYIYAGVHVYGSTAHSIHEGRKKVNINHDVEIMIEVI